MSDARRAIEQAEEALANEIAAAIGNTIKAATGCNLSERDSYRILEKAGELVCLVPMARH